MRFIARHQVELVDRAGLRIDAEGGRIEHVLRGGDQIAAVGRPGERAEAAIEILRQRRDHARLHVAQHHHHPVRLVSRTGHGGIGEILAVGRGRRQRVIGLVRSGQIDRRLAAEVREPDIEIGGGGLVPVGFARDEIEARAVGRPGDVLIAAERLGRRVAGRSARADRSVHGDASAGGPALREIEHEDTADRAGRLPAVPMAHEALVALIKPSVARTGQMRGPIGLAAESRAAARDFGPDRELVALGRDGEPIDGGVETGDERRRPDPTRRRHAGAPDAHAFVARSGRLAGREEIELIVRPEAEPRHRTAEIEPDRLDALARQVEQIGDAGARIARRVGFGHCVDRQSPVRRHGRRAETRQSDEVLCAHGRTHRSGARRVCRLGQNRRRESESGGACSEKGEAGRRPVKGVHARNVSRAG